MIPYVPAPVFSIGDRQISLFTLLVLLALLTGAAIALIRAHRLGIDGTAMRRMGFWTLTSGLAGAHLAKAAMDRTPQFLADPSILLRSGGIRSLGGFIGGLLGAFLYTRARRISAPESFRMLDVAAFALPFAWMIGRLGCFLVHDHRGELTTSWIAVQFPEGPRYDLGLIEFLFLIGLSTLFYWLDRRPRPVGFFFVLFALTYSPFRIWLDTLHVQPYRFYGGIVGCAIGAAGWLVIRKQQRARPATFAHGPSDEERRNRVRNLAAETAGEKVERKLWRSSAETRTSTSAPNRDRKGADRPTVTPTRNVELPFNPARKKP